MTSLPKTLYVGSFRHNLDAKNRLTIPSKWRFQGDQEDVYLAFPHTQGCIMVLPPAAVERLYEKVNEINLGNEEGQDLLNRIFSEAHQMGCDKQGRMSLPENLLAKAGIEKEALLVGTMTKFGIWNPDRWENRHQGDDRKVGDLMTRLGF